MDKENILKIVNKYFGGTPSLDVDWLSFRDTPSNSEEDMAADFLDEIKNNQGKLILMDKDLAKQALEYALQFHAEHSTDEKLTESAQNIYNFLNGEKKDSDFKVDIYSREGRHDLIKILTKIRGEVKFPPLVECVDNISWGTIKSITEEILRLYLELVMNIQKIGMDD